MVLAPVVENVDSTIHFLNNQGLDFKSLDILGLSPTMTKALGLSPIDVHFLNKFVKVCLSFYRFNEGHASRTHSG